MQHHDDTLAAYVEQVAASDDTLAVVATGSVARRAERPDSDVDVCLVVTDAAFEAARRDQRLSYVLYDVATYDGGYVDVKVVSPDSLAAAVERADEPTRASLAGARVVWSRVDDLEALLARITELPEAEWERRAASFIAQARLYGGYFLAQGAQLEDPYLTRWAAVHLVNAACRALLAHHHVLFAGPKYLRKTVRSLQSIPEGFAELADRVLETPTPALGAELLESLERFHAWPVTPDEKLSRFVADNELAWLWREPAPESL